MTAHPLINTGWPSATTTRIGLLRTVACDVLTLLLTFASCAALAFVYLLIRTDRGALDAPAPDAALAAAIAAAAVPVWTAYQWRRGIRVGGARSLLGITLHPANAPAWYWLATTLELLSLRLPALVVLALAVTVTLLAVASFLLLLLRPEAQPLHIQITNIHLRRPA